MGFYSAIADLQTKNLDSVPKLQSILFLVTNGDDNHAWRTANLGKFVADFAVVVDENEVYKIYQRLFRGEKVTFPGVFDLDVLKGRLGGW